MQYNSNVLFQSSNTSALSLIDSPSIIHQNLERHEKSFKVFNYLEKLSSQFLINAWSFGLIHKIKLNIMSKLNRAYQCLPNMAKLVIYSYLSFSELIIKVAKLNKKQRSLIQSSTILNESKMDTKFVLKMTTPNLVCFLRDYDFTQNFSSRYYSRYNSNINYVLSVCTQLHIEINDQNESENRDRSSWQAHPKGLIKSIHGPAKDDLEIVHLYPPFYIPILDQFKDGNISISIYNRQSEWDIQWCILSRFIEELRSQQVQIRYMNLSFFNSAGTRDQLIYLPKTSQQTQQKLLGNQLSCQKIVISVLPQFNPYFLQP